MPWRVTRDALGHLFLLTSELMAHARRGVTNPRVFEHPEPIRDAWEQVRIWLTAETAWIPQPTERHSDPFGQFLALPGVYGNLVPDAHPAALAVEHGLTLCSTDGDFARFHQLRWVTDRVVTVHARQFSETGAVPVSAMATGC